MATSISTPLRFGRSADLGGPVGIGTPGGRLKHYAQTIAIRDPNVIVEVTLEPVDAGRIFEQHIGGVLRQLVTVVKDEVGFQPSVGDE
jgi:hypothetical protein